MLTRAMQFWQDESGFVLSAELVLIATLCVIGLIAGLSCVRDAVVAELNDVGAAFRSVQQDYAYSGMHGCRTRCGTSSWVAGSAYVDGTNTAVQYHQDIGRFEGTVEECVETVPTPCLPTPQQPAIDMECPPPTIPYCPPTHSEPRRSIPTPIPAPSFGANATPPAPCGCETIAPAVAGPCQTCSQPVPPRTHGISTERYFWEVPSFAGRTLIPTSLAW